MRDAPRKTSRKTSPKKQGASTLLTGLAFGVYAVLLAMLTLLKSRLSLGGLWNTEAHHYRSLDLQLFNGFVDAPIWWGPWTNTFGNIALFMPMGFYLYQILRKHRRSHFTIVEVTLYSAVISMVIEVLQWVFALGYTDVDDLLLNTIGGLLGGLVSMTVGARSLKKFSWIILGGSLAVAGLMVYSSMVG